MKYNDLNSIAPMNGYFAYIRTYTHCMYVHTYIVAQKQYIMGIRRNYIRIYTVTNDLLNPTS